MASTQIVKTPDPMARGSQLNLPPRIASNRRLLDDSFPVLGFTIFSDRPGYYEVLLATNPAQLAVSGTREPSTSYSSRQDSGLIPIPLGTSVYLAPTAVLRNFVQARPRPSQVYYTVVLYSDQSGTQGVFAQPPETLATSAPSVTISQHFGSDGFGDVLGMRPDRMRRVVPTVSQNLAAVFSNARPEEDRADGEDGTSAPPLLLSSHAAESNYEDGYQGQPDGSDYSEPPHATASSDADYDDGYAGEPQPGSTLGLSAAQQSSFRAGDSEPAVLEDESVDDDHGSYGEYRSSEGGTKDSGEPSQYHAAESSASQQAFDDDDDDDDFRSGYGPPKNGGGESGKFYAARSSDAPDAEAYCPEPAAVATAYGDEADEGTDPAPAYRSLDVAAVKGVPLGIEAKRDLIGKLGDYGAIRADAEFSGVYGREHPAYQHYHLGLSFGIALFNQEHGDLGKLLDALRERDSAKFAEIFGPDAEALIHVLKSTGPSSNDTSDGRSSRLQPVGGADVWQEPWLSRFREAGYYKPFQAVQNKIAAELFLDPMLRFAGWLGLETERSLAILMDRAAELGVAPAQQWIVNAVGPFQTPLQRHQALAALGFESIRTFQAAHPGTDTNGQWGPLTHAAAVGALRHKGNSPVPLPTVEQMLDALVRRSARTPSFERVRALRNDSRFADTPFHLGQEHEK